MPGISIEFTGGTVLMKNIHFIGIGGIGMSGIAQILLAKGYSISGSDLKMSHITDRLIGCGATIYQGHNSQNIGSADTVVISSAIPETNPELVFAREKGLTILQRAEMLSFLMNDQIGIAVAGTHGKTTTTSMIAFVMNLAGLNPTAIIGGELTSISSNAALGAGTYLVAEADESDASFLHLSPVYAIITNIDSDVNFNIEPYKSCAGDYSLIMEKITGVFLEFTERVSEDGKIFICTDSEYVRRIVSRLNKTFVSYGISHPADIHAENIRLSDFHSECEVYCKSEYMGKLSLKVPGRHNIQNALACIGVCMEAGLSFENIADALSHFEGLRRRFEVFARLHGVMVVDDYAHNPSKLRAAVHACGTGDASRIISVFQPHRYSRTHFLFQELSEAFDATDVLIVTDIYPAGEKPIPGVTAQALSELIRKKSPGTKVYYISSFEEIVDWLCENTMSGDIVMTLGAGNIYKVSRSFAEKLVFYENSSSQTNPAIPQPLE